MSYKNKSVFTYALLTLFISGFSMFILFNTLFNTRIENYVLVNQTNETLYASLILLPNTSNNKGFSASDQNARMHGYNLLKPVDITPKQFLSQNLPALPSFHKKDIRLNPQSRIEFYLDFDEISLQNKHQIVLIKNEENNYYKLDVNFKATSYVIEKDDLNIKATESMINILEKSSGNIWSWLFLLIYIFLILFFPYLLFKTVLKK